MNPFASTKPRGTPPTCAACRHFMATKPDASEGVCRRYPPGLFMVEPPQVGTADTPARPATFTSQFIFVRATFGCGEFAR